MSLMRTCRNGIRDSRRGTSQSSAKDDVWLALPAAIGLKIVLGTRAISLASPIKCSSVCLKSLEMLPQWVELESSWSKGWHCPASPQLGIPLCVQKLGAIAEGCSSLTHHGSAALCAIIFPHCLQLQLKDTQRHLHWSIRSSRRHKLCTHNFPSLVPFVSCQNPAFLAKLATCASFYFHASLGISFSFETT